MKFSAGSTNITAIGSCSSIWLLHRGAAFSAFTRSVTTLQDKHRADDSLPLRIIREGP